jgi:uncharacterized membrane protein
MMMTVNHLIYLSASLLVTVWVGQTLHKNGRPFLIDIFAGNTNMADATNHLLLVGYYLTNVALVSLALKYGEAATTVEQSIERLSTKIGLVLLVLGGMHFFNLIVLWAIRRPQNKARVAECQNVHRLEV